MHTHTLLYTSVIAQSQPGGLRAQIPATATSHNSLIFFMASFTQLPKAGLEPSIARLTESHPPKTVLFSVWLL